MLAAEVFMPEGDLSRADVERYLRVNRGGKGVFAVITGAAAVLGLMIGFAVTRPDEHSLGSRQGRRDRNTAFVIAAVFGGLGLGVAVLTDNVRRRLQLHLTSDQIRRLDQALIDNADVNTEVDRALIERTLARANRV
jgi:hypothetical protein